MGDYFKKHTDWSDSKDYYDHGQKTNYISSHLYVAYKERNMSAKKEETKTFDAENLPQPGFLLKSWSTLDLPDSPSGYLIEKEFNELASKWKDETGLFSTTYQKIIHDTYFDLVAMGKQIVPYILTDLQNNGPASWHTALKALTKENPIAEEDLSKNKKIREGWITWGKRKNLI